MPLYEYLCSCGLKFDALKNVDEGGTAECPKCGKRATKVMSVVNHSFGWALSERSHERFGPRDEYVKDV